jgi:hypothetical protein
MTPKKMTFWRPFWRFFVRSRAAETYCHPPPFHLILLCIQTTREREKSRRAVVHSAVPRQSSFQSVSSCWPRRVRGWRVLSRAHSLSLSYCIAGTAPFWADFRNRSALWHTMQRPGEVSLHLVKARSKLNGRWYLTYFPHPGWFGIKRHHYCIKSQF